MKKLSGIRLRQLQDNSLELGVKKKGKWEFIPNPSLKQLEDAMREFGWEESRIKREMLSIYEIR